MTAGNAQVVLIRPEPRGLAGDLREAFSRLDLLWFLVTRDIKVRYAQTVMGLGWAIVRPLFSVLVFTIVFGRLAEIPSDGLPYAVFSFAAMVPWLYFNGAVQQSTASLIRQRNVFTKIYYPRLFIPAAPIISALMDLGISFTFFLAMCWGVWGIVPSADLLALPIALVIMVATAFGLGLWMSALAVQYRDISLFSAFFLQALMYLTPVVWPLSLVKDKFPEHIDLILAAYGLFPMVGVIEIFRATVSPEDSIPWLLLGSGALGAFLILASGLAFFRHRAPLFADVA